MAQMNMDNENQRDGHEAFARAPRSATGGAPLTVTDPLERTIEAALLAAGIRYATDYGGGNPVGLDFFLPDFDLHIEVKGGHSERIAAQMSRAPNVIVAQGGAAVRFLAAMLENAKSPNGCKLSDAPTP